MGDFFAHIAEVHWSFHIVSCRPLFWLIFCKRYIARCFTWSMSPCRFLVSIRWKTCSSRVPYMYHFMLCHRSHCVWTHNCCDYFKVCEVLPRSFVGMGDFNSAHFVSCHSIYIGGKVKALQVELWGKKKTLFQLFWTKICSQRVLLLNFPAGHVCCHISIWIL